MFALLLALATLLIIAVMTQQLRRRSALRRRQRPQRAMQVCAGWHDVPMHEPAPGCVLVELPHREKAASDR